MTDPFSTSPQRLAFDVADWIQHQAKSLADMPRARCVISFIQQNPGLLQAPDTPRVWSNLMGATRAASTDSESADILLSFAPLMLAGETAAAFQAFARDNQRPAALAASLLENGRMDADAFDTRFGEAMSAEPNSFGFQFALELGAQAALLTRDAGSSPERLSALASRFEIGSELLTEELQSAARLHFERLSDAMGKPSLGHGDPLIETSSEALFKIAGKLRSKAEAREPEAILNPAPRA